MTQIRRVAEPDRGDWQVMWDAYLTFYESTLPDAVTSDVFARLVADEELHGVIAWDDDGNAVGLVHWLLHPSTWSTTSYCYLEDLFVSPAARGLGVGEALIAHVKADAGTRGASKVYWLTHESNATAQRLYDRVADRTGFIHFEQPL